MRAGKIYNFNIWSVDSVKCQNYFFVSHVLNPFFSIELKKMPERPPIQVKKIVKYIMEDYGKKVNMKMRTIIRMGGVNPALSEIGRSE